MPDREATVAGGGRLASRLGLILTAIILGALVPIAVVAFLAYRDPLPQSCQAGRATVPAIEGTILYTDKMALWFVEGDLNNPRKLADYGPPTPPSPSPRPSGTPASAAPTAAAATPSPAATASAAAVPTSSPSPSVPQPKIVAATISSDHHTVAYAVIDPPGAVGKIAVRVVDPLQANPPSGGSDAWTDQHPDFSGRTELTFLDAKHILFRTPHRYDPPETSTRMVGVIVPGYTPPLVESAPEAKFVSDLHATWSETKDIKLPPDMPLLDSRVIGPNDAVAGVLDRNIQTPLVSRTIHEVVTGRLGEGATTAVCAAFDKVAPAAFSPDGRTLALSGGGTSYVLDLSGGHAAVSIFSGQILDWRP